MDGEEPTAPSHVPEMSVAKYAPHTASAQLTRKLVMLNVGASQALVAKTAPSHVQD
jgi:hypothetical protein